MAAAVPQLRDGGSFSGVRKMTKAVVLIDGGYLSKILKKFFKQARLDFLLFSENICLDCRRIQTYYYTCMPYQSGTPTYEERTRYARMDKFLNAVRKLDKFTVKLGRLLKKDEDVFEQKGVDVEFALDLVELSTLRRIDKAFIVSGDSDFVPVVERANLTGIRTQNVYHPIEFSYHLRDICHESRIIDQKLIDDSLLPKK